MEIYGLTLGALGEAQCLAGGVENVKEDLLKCLHASLIPRHWARSGSQPYLSYEELVTYLVKCAEIRYPKTKDEVIGIVNSLKEGAGGRDLWIVLFHQW